MNQGMSDALRDIQGERLRQLGSLGYTPEHDAEHTPINFANMIVEYAENIVDDDAGGARSAFVKIGALAVAAIEALDR